MSTPILQVIQDLNHAIKVLEHEKKQLEKELRQLKEDYVCACTDLEATRKELLRARS